MNLYKTTLVIWTEYNPANVEINRLAEEAVNGSAYCSKEVTIRTETETDPDWDGTEFFDLQDPLIINIITPN